MRRSILGALLCLMFPVAAVAVPSQIPYSGQLSESGQPVTGSRDLTVNLYADSLGGSPVYTEAFPGTPVSSGIFHVRLSVPEGVWDGSDRWLGVSVNGGAELVPRTKLGSVPYAVHASRVATTTTTHHLALHPSEFVPFFSTTVHHVDDASLYTSTDDHFVAPVNLPDGAVIIAQNLCGHFPEQSGRVEGGLIRIPAWQINPSLHVSLGYSDLYGVQGTDVCSETAAWGDLTDRTVDNTNYVYLYRIGIWNGANPNTAWLLSARVDYTLPDVNVGP